MQYDYSKATKRINDLRRKVIMQKGGESVEGLSLIIIENKSRNKKSPKKSQSQDIKQ